MKALRGMISRGHMYGALCPLIYFMEYSWASEEWLPLMTFEATFVFTSSWLIKVYADNIDI